MSRPEVPDTGFFIEAMRQPTRWPAFERSLSGGQVWLSTVVVCELYAGTRSPDDAFRISQIVGAMESVDRLLAPTPGEWARAGRLIARHMRVRGPVRPRDHLADVLILVSAARLKATVVTANLRHFEPWARLARAAGMDVVVTPLGE